MSSEFGKTYYQNQSNPFLAVRIIDYFLLTINSTLLENREAGGTIKSRALAGLPGWGPRLGVERSGTPSRKKRKSSARSSDSANAASYC